jgi:quercetin dioxygenase-like cupin family protein
MDATALVVGPGEGSRLFNPVGGQVTYKVRGEESGGRMTVFESVIAPGEGPPLHVHANEEETLYVLDGAFRFQLGEELRDAPRGALMFVPRGVPHCFQNTGEEPGTLLITFAPAGMEHFFELIGADPSKFAEAAAQVGMEVVGPSLAQRQS